jgi:HK97 family phage portal protein
VKFLDAMSTALTGQRPPVPYVSQRRAGALISGYGGARASLLGLMGTNGTLFSTVSRYANATSQVDWHLYRKSKSGNEEDRKEITSHLAISVWSAPNAFTHQQLFVEASQQHLELVGEAWWVVERNEFGWPESMWLVRPDRMAPVPSETLGISGYVYQSPDGRQIPLTTDDVIWLKMPNPVDVGPTGRGLGAAQTILAQVEGVNFSAMWNRNFFANSALPGGIISVPNELSDESFRRLRMQWAERHQGVANAHRVAVMESGATWESGPSQKDMEFVDLLNTSRDVIREAYAMPKFMLGLVDDVNRATAEASDASFGTWGLVPRCERIKQALNTRFLPLFGPSGHGTGTPDVEFDYDDPVPPDRAAENADLTAKVNAYAVLVKNRVEPESAAETVGLPPMMFAELAVEPVAVPSQLGAGQDVVPVEEEPVDA